MSNYYSNIIKVFISFILVLGMGYAFAEKPSAMLKNPKFYFDVFEHSHAKANIPTLYIFEDLGCPHCAEFQQQYLQKLIHKYVDTGKIRIVEIPFILNELTGKASLLVLSLPLKKRVFLVTSYLTSQRVWLAPAIKGYGKSAKEINAAVLRNIENTAKMNGVSSSTIQQEVNNKQKMKDLLALRAHISKTYNINGTPAFLIYVKGKPQVVDGYNQELMQQLEGHIDQAIKK